jgi:acyl carrier protein
MNLISNDSKMPVTEFMPATQSRTMSESAESGIKARLRAFVQENFLYAMPNFELGDDDLLMEKGVIDSMGVAEMIAFVESEFGVTTADEEVSEANFGSLSAISRFITAKQLNAIG